MESIKHVNKEDLEFCNICITKTPSRDFFALIKYDKTLSERNYVNTTTKLSLIALEIIKRLEICLSNMDGVIAARATGSVPSGLLGSSTQNTLEEINGDKVIFKAIKITKLPDIDLEVIVRNNKFVDTPDFSLLNRHLRNLSCSELRISLGLIAYKDTVKPTYKNLIRWGYLHNHIILKGSTFYRKKCDWAWEYIIRHGIEKKIDSYVGYHHLAYALQNSIKYGRINELEVEKKLHPKLYLTITSWNKSKNVLFYKKDYASNL